MQMTSAFIHQINAAPDGGVPKSKIESAQITVNGIVGDAQKDLKHHGGPERALCLYSLEIIKSLQSLGHPIFPGSTGENITITGLDWSRLVPQTRLKMGATVIIEITKATTPCKTIAASFQSGAFKTISHKIAPLLTRYYARVITEGVIRTGDAISVVEEMVIP